MPKLIQQTSQTERNLWNAIVSESLAHMKYTAFAMKALEEGHPEIGQVFQEVAGAETIHGINHLKVTGEIKTSTENLKGVIAGESKEFSTLYPRMIRDALDEGQHEAAETFRLAMDKEIQHLETFSKSLEALELKLAEMVSDYSKEYPIPDSLKAVSPIQLPKGNPLPKDNFLSDAGLELDGERQRVAAFGRIREVVFGAQDGLLSTVALVTSVAAAVGEAPTIIAAGLAAALAGMFSMGSGSYLGSKAEKDLYKAEIAKEAKELEENPAEEMAELVFLFHQQGLTYSQAKTMAEHIALDKDLWLRTLVEKELGINPDVLQSPIKDGFTMAGAFIAGAIVPIIPYFLMAEQNAMVISIVAALVGLFALGMAKGRVVKKAPLIQGVEILFVGLLATGVGYLLGEGASRLLT